MKEKSNITPATGIRSGLDPAEDERGGRPFFNMIEHLLKPIECPAQLFVLDRMEMLSGIGRPEYSGVYAVCMMKISDRDEEYRCTVKEHYVLYVGSAKNIKRRISNPSHPFHLARNEWGDQDHIVYLRHFQCDDYKERERQAIRLFRPPMNTHHNGKAVH